MKICVESCWEDKEAAGYYEPEERDPTDHEREFAKVKGTHYKGLPSDCESEQDRDCIGDLVTDSGDTCDGNESSGCIRWSESLQRKENE